MNVEMAVGGEFDKQLWGQDWEDHDVDSEF